MAESDEGIWILVGDDFGRHTHTFRSRGFVDDIWIEAVVGLVI